MKIGLVLSGGAAWGLANIGVLDVLEREGIGIDCIAGSSMGAIVAGAFACGVSVDKLKDISRDLTVFNIASFAKAPLKGGLHGGIFRHKLEELLSPSLGDATIGDCRIPFVCVAARVKKPIPWEKIVLPRFADRFFDSVEPYVFPPSTRLIDALLASSAIPVAFSPVSIGNEEFIDLLHVGAVPTSYLRRLHTPDVVIGTDTQPRYDNLRKILPPSWREYLDRGHAILDREKSLCDIMVEPRLTGSIFRFDKAMTFIDAGKRAMDDSLDDLNAAFRSKQGQKGAA
jgi:NTE family protein